MCPIYSQIYIYIYVFNDAIQLKIIQLEVKYTFGQAWYFFASEYFLKKLFWTVAYSMGGPSRGALITPFPPDIDICNNNMDKNSFFFFFFNEGRKYREGYFFISYPPRKFLCIRVNN